MTTNKKVALITGITGQDGSYLADQKLLRDSVGSVTASGMVTNIYQEKRDNTELLVVRVKKISLFFTKCLLVPLQLVVRHFWVAY